MLRKSAFFALSLSLGIMGTACSDDAETSNVAGGAGAAGDAGGGAGMAGSAGSGGQTEDAGQDVQPDVYVGPVSFSDPSLEQCVRTALGQPDGDILAENLSQLMFLECQDMGIVSLAGLEHATALADLSLFENEIEDLTPLTALTQVRDLQLGNNKIADVSALSGMSELRRLGLVNNQVSSLAPLASLTSLEWLNLDRNAFGDGELPHLSGLTNLRWLTLEHNGIMNRAPLQPLVDAGCDIYDQYGSINPFHATRWPAPAGSGNAPASLANLRPRLTASGQVFFRYAHDGKLLPVRHVTGNLSTRGDRVLHRVGDRTVDVGRIVKGEPVLCEADYAKTCELAVGVRWPEPGAVLPGTVAEPVVTVSLQLLDAPRHQVLDGEAWGTEDTDMLPFVLASPNQLDAGSCLFMATTGTMEILINQHTAPENIKYDGDTDLSERYLMTVGDHVSSSVAPYYLTDTLYLFEAAGGALLNRDYRFCVGYVKETASGSITPAQKTDEGAYASCSYNWFDFLPTDWKEMLVPTPPADRTVIFADPKRDDNSQWRVALFDDSTIEKIKYELRTKNAPVIVVYNHFLYWHANVIVGYDDTLATSGCPFVEDSIDYFEEKGASSYANAIRTRMDEQGGCRTHGKFFVRDSIYDGGNAEPEYDYSENGVSYSDKYSRRILTLEYDWAKYLGNHTYAVHRK